MEEGTYGIDPKGVTQAQEDLGECYTAFSTWHEDLWALKDQVIADWYGGGSEQFESSYNVLSQKMEAFINVAKQYQDFAMANLEGWNGVDNADQSAMMF